MAEFLKPKQTVKHLGNVGHWPQVGGLPVQEVVTLSPCSPCMLFPDWLRRSSEETLVSQTFMEARGRRKEGHAVIWRRFEVPG